MRHFRILFAKEMKENFRRRRLQILGVVFLLFAILSPVVARFMPALVESLLATQQGGGISIQLPDPVAGDAYLQFFKNLTQMGVLLYMLLYMGSVTEEKRKGSAVLVLTKGVSRTSFLLAKLASSLASVLSVYALSSLVFLFYVQGVFEVAPEGADFLALGAFAGYFVVLAAMTLLASTLASSTAMAAVGAIGGYFLISVLDLLPVIRDYSPTALSTVAYEIAMGTGKLADLAWPTAVSLLSAVLLTVLAVLAFRRQEL